MKRSSFAFLILVIMILGEVYFLKLTTRNGAAANLGQLLIASLTITFGIILFIAIIKLFFNLFERNYKFKNLVTSMEFWFKCIKGGFIIWVIKIMLIGFDQIFI